MEIFGRDFSKCHTIINEKVYFCYLKCFHYAHTPTYIRYITFAWHVCILEHYLRPLGYRISLLFLNTSLNTWTGVYVTFPQIITVCFRYNRKKSQTSRVCNNLCGSDGLFHPELCPLHPMYISWWWHERVSSCVVSTRQTGRRRIRRNKKVWPGANLCPSDPFLFLRDTHVYFECVISQIDTEDIQKTGRKSVVVGWTSCALVQIIYLPSWSIPVDLSKCVSQEKEQVLIKRKHRG